MRYCRSLSCCVQVSKRRENKKFETNLCTTVELLYNTLQETLEHAMEGD